MAKQELKYQKYIVDSYKRAGGYAKKWSSEWAVGNPDLVCALEPFRPHLIEVKHRPTWDGIREINNPVTEKQALEMAKWMGAGFMCALGIVTGDKAINARLHLCWPIAMKVRAEYVFSWADYQPGKGFPMKELITLYERVYNAKINH